MKKLIALLLSLTLLLGLAACGGGSEKTPAPPEGNGDTAGDPSGTSGETPDHQTGGKTLVVYYSATNHTKRAAEFIASATGGDLFELVPTDLYTEKDLDWQDPDSRVSREHDDPTLRAVRLENISPDNWADYDTVFLGYPIWWGIAAWPVDGFVSSNDFTGKTVIPFCTSASSELGESGELLKTAAGTGNWLAGMRFPSDASEDAVREWVKGLGLSS